MHLATRTQKLERAYQETLRATTAVQEAEQRRRIRMRLALLESENEDLQESIRQRDGTIEELSAERNSLSEQISIVSQSLEATRQEMRVAARTAQLVRVCPVVQIFMAPRC